MVLNPFDFGMRLEAKDRLHPQYLAVAHICSVQGSKVKIRFDGWGERTEEFDYWADWRSIDLHPIGYCISNGIELCAPGKGIHSDINVDEVVPNANLCLSVERGRFEWTEYLESSGFTPAPSHFFTSVKFFSILI